MNQPSNPRRSVFVAALAGLALSGGLAFGQATTPASTSGATTTTRVPTPTEVNRSTTSAPASSDESVTTLSPFEVRAEEDHGYQATSTLAGTRLRSDLKDLAASISVVTKDMMNDLNATDLTSLLVYTTGTEVGGLGGNFLGYSNNPDFGDTNDMVLQASPQTRLRGLIGADVTRGYFLSNVPLEGYNTERVEISRGANSILFGLGSPSGIVNYSIIKADANKTKTNVTGSFGSYSSYRGTLDHNQVLIKDKLAVRLAGLFNNTRYRTEDAYGKRRGITLSAVYRPLKNTTIRVTSEFGRNDSNNPEVNPPKDRLTWWWLAGKPVWNPVTSVGRLLSTPTAPFTPTTVFNAAGARGATAFTTANWGGTSTNEPIIFYTDPNSSQVGGIKLASGQTVDGVKSFADFAYRNAANNANINGGWVGLGGWSGVYQAIYIPNDPTKALYSRDWMINDPAIFDFYHQMLAGPSKYEWYWYDTHNASIEQTFLDGRAGFELSFMRERMDTGGISPTSNQLSIDINELMPDGSPNPNFGRPLNLSGGFKHVYAKDNDAARLTAYYNLDLKRVGPNWLGRLLGTHAITGTYSRQTNSVQHLGGSLYDMGLDWPASNGLTLPQTVSSTNRIFGVGHYMGPSMLATASPADAILSAPTVGQEPRNASFTILTNNRPASATAPYIPWTVNNYTTSLQSLYGVTQLRNSYQNLQEQQVHSLSFAVQSHILDDMFVTTLGWRKDAAWSFDAGVPVANSLGSSDISPSAWYPKLVRQVEGQSRSYGIVGRLPTSLRRKLPWGTDLSVFYNYATNFRVAALRYNIMNDPIPSETGETKEYGVRLSTLNGKLDFKVAHYETTAGNATVGSIVGGLNQLADMVGLLIDKNYTEGANVNNPAGIQAFETWLNSPNGKIYQNAFSYAFVPNNDRPKFTAGDARGSYADATGFRGYINGVSALRSTGWEFELVVNPTSRWRVFANASSQEAVRTDVAPDLRNFLLGPDSLLTLVQDASGKPTDFGKLQVKGTDTVYNYYINNVVNNGPLKEFSQEGAKNDELAPWKFNAGSNYTFNPEWFGGRLKGWAIGGAYRWSDRRLLGYASKMATIGSAAVAVSDVSKPYYSDTEFNVDGWISYQRKLSHGINWKAQLNVRNIGVGNELRPTYVNPDGRVVWWTIREAQRWTLTNSFSF